MRRLSTPLENIQDKYDVVVIGSGYGGSIAASRLSRAGWNVCLLERGREFMPGEFPDTNAEVTTESQFDTELGKIGNPTGLFNYHVNEEINVLVGCGLGGTSLINANVALHPVRDVFLEGGWPAAIISDLDNGVQKGYERAAEMLRPRTYPVTYPPLKKAAAMQYIAGRIGEPWYPTPINVTFEDRVNEAGVEQKACINCGDCVTGCNHLAKNTTQMNYLPDAVNHGATIFTECHVEYIEKKDDTWLVHFKPSGVGQDVFAAPPQFVEADIVVVSAGTLGSSEIILRSKQKGLSTSPMVGHKFSGNGDVLGFSYNSDRRINGIGYGTKPVDPANPAGPNIASIIDTRLSVTDWRKGMSIEEGVIPGALAGLLPAAFAAISAAIGQDTDTGIVDRLKEQARILDSLVLGAYHGATINTITYLVMSHDSGKGVMYLDQEDRLRIDWPGAGEEPNIDMANDMLLNCTKQVGGTYVESPIWTTLFKKSLITVHALGGCAMADDATLGVVNDKGQVFSGATGTAVHKGLYIMDGSVVPTALGTNPLFTISALSERSCALLVKDYGKTLTYDFAPVLAPEPEEETVGIQFTEEMDGFVAIADEADFAEAERRGKQLGQPFSFTLTVRSEDVNDLLTNPDHKAKMVGTVRCPLLSTEEITVTDGVFNLFPADPDRANTRLMNYRANLTTQEGSLYTMHGTKYIHDDDGLDIWADTTTLFLTLTDGHNSDAPTSLRGILHIQPLKFIKQITTLKAINASSTAERLSAISRFGEFFAGVLFKTYGGVATGSRYFNPDAPPRKKRALRTEAPEVHFVKTADGVSLRLTRYRGGTKGPLLCLHGLGVSSEIFSTDMIPTNLVEFLYAHGYDVWLLDNRSSTAFPDIASREASGDDIARWDYPAAVETVLEKTGAANLQVLAHCYGSTTWVMSMLSGLQGVRSAVCSQVGAHMVAPIGTKLKTGLHVPGVLDALGVDSLTAYVDADSGWMDKLFDHALALNPANWKQYDPNPVSRRITFLYSRLYELDNLNEVLYNNLHELFGVASIRQFEHLATMVRKGTVVSADGDDVYMPNLGRLALPVLFLSGAKNDCFLPESTERTRKALAQANGAGLYERQVIPGYGHIDCIFGQQAWRDVYPFIAQHLDAHQ